MDGEWTLSERDFFAHESLPVGGHCSGMNCSICGPKQHKPKVDGPESEQLRGKSDCKPSNPKDLIGSDKLPLHLWPTAATALGCIGMLEGTTKYGRLNFRHAGIRASIYVDACKRHLDAWMEGEDNAPDTGSRHLANAHACLGIIADALANEMLTDDRNHVPHRGSWRRFIDIQCTPHVKRLKELFKDKNPHHYTIADTKEKELHSEIDRQFGVDL